MFLKLRSVLIFLVAIAIFSGGFLGIFTSPRQAKAANISFQIPGQWSQNGSTGMIYNEIDMLQDGVSSTVKWGYTPEGSGVIFYKPYGGDNKPIENVTRFRLSEPRDMISTANVISYYLFVVNGKAIDIGYKLDKNDLANEDFLWGSSLQALQSDISTGESFTKAKGGANTPLGSYLAEISDYVRLNKPAIPLQTSTGPTTEAKKACENKLIGPLSKSSGGNPLQSVFKAINDKLGMQVISPISDSEDLGLYHKFFKTTDGRDYSDTYIDTTTTATYKNFVNEFQLTESGLAWFWTDKTASTQKNSLYTLIGSASILSMSGGVLTLAPAAVGTVATLGVDYYKANVNADQWPKVARLLTAKVYLDAHMQYDRCIAQNTTDQSFKDKLAKEEKNYKQILGLISQQVADYIDAQNQANTGIGGDTCGLPLKAGAPAYFIGQALCSVLNFLADIAKMLVNSLFQSVFNAYHPPDNLKLSTLTNIFSIPQAHAADSVSPLINAFTNQAGDWSWVVTVWKFVLTLTDLFLVVILLFLGIVNILHIQYDTYAIKKMLPLLIVGVILANFSLLIMRMLIDASNILTKSFMNGSPGDAVKGLINNFGLSENQLPNFTQNSSVAWQSVGGLFLAVIFSIFAIAAFLILGVMFYIRYAAILLLGIAAPLAFIALAFPPTQSLFKQWWSWTTKFVFMKPVAMFLIMVATQMKGEGAATGITGWMIITFLVYMAILVPWKLGGAISSAWGGAMGSLFGTKKGGWANKPVNDWWQRRKDQIGARTKMALPGLFTGAEADRMKNETMKKTADNILKEKAWKRNDVTAWEGKAKHTEDRLKDFINKRTLQMEEGKLDLSWRLRMQLGGITWQGIKPKLKDSEQFAADAFKDAAELEISTKNLEAHRKDATWGAIIDMGRNNAEFSQQLQTLKDRGIGLNTIEVDENGILQRTTVYKTDDNGAFLIDKNGNPIEDQATYRDYMEAAAFTRMKGLAAKDPKVAQNYFNSAAQMEKQAAEFARTHTHLDNKPILYNAFMDKNKSGRIFSATTSWILDEISTNTMNENAETMVVRFKEGGYGWRNNRGSHLDLVNLARGEYSKIDPTAIAPAVAEYRTWLEFIGRKGGKDRGRIFANFLDQVDTGEIYGEENKGRLLKSLLEKENHIRDGASDEFVAEVFSTLKRRGINEFGGIDFSDIEYTKTGQMTENTIPQLLEKLKAAKINSVDFIASNPEIFRQMDLTSFASRAQRNMMDGVSDLLEESSNFCGAGNPVGYTVKTKDRDKTDWFSDFTSRENVQQVMKRRASKAAKYQQYEVEAQSLGSQTPEQIITQTGSAQRAAQRYAPVADLLITNASQLASGIKINGQTPNFTDFQNQIATAIKNSVATTVSNLQAELSQQFAGLTIDIPQLDTPEALESYKRQVGENQNALATYAQLEQNAEAENYRQYTTVNPNENIQSLASSLNQLQEASDSLKEASDKIAQSADPTQKIPEAVINKAIDALAARGQVVPLSKQALKEDETKLGDILQKMVVGLKGAINAKEQTGSLENKAILEGIKAELVKGNQTAANQAAGGTVPPSAGPTTPSAPPPGGQPPTQQPPQQQGPAGGPSNANDLT